MLMLIITRKPGRSYGKMRTMPRKKKQKRFRAVEAVKEMARERIGTPKPGRVVPDKRTEKVEKHKPSIEKLLSED